MTTVLLVDDQIQLCYIYIDYLQRHGYRVLTAEDGVTALQTARAESPDVILMDFSMPQRSGADVARDLKADPRTAEIPIVMLTALPYGAVGRAAREAGCSGYLAKPCGPRRVLLEVERQTARRSA
jgi:CheY-like chemotaxis protein